MVNLAARLCAEAANGEILIDQRTYASTRSVLERTDVRRLQLKGFADPVTARVVDGLVAPDAKTTTTPVPSA